MRSSRVESRCEPLAPRLNVSASSSAANRRLGCAAHLQRCCRRQHTPQPFGTPTSKRNTPASASAITQCLAIPGAASAAPGCASDRVGIYFSMASIALCMAHAAVSMPALLASCSSRSRGSLFANRDISDAVWIQNVFHRSQRDRRFL